MDLAKNISLVATKITLSLGRSNSAHVIELFFAATGKADSRQPSTVCDCTRLCATAGSPAVLR
ncbi:hypothetical protein A6X21_04365 [Planctopirus hydrillae]|uniref:Uncharacterized protein n=1 Tax=Planctopirus hydrillae TaxID=1841610 RepID=A0A1C3ENQ4_9PLAN|nr:hypothetical protein A6X21_04365 [Planctopirus hydrillae]